MEVLCRRGRLGHLHVVLGALSEEPFKSRARVFWSLALETVRQQQDESALLQPFVLARAQELVDDDLSAVDEVAELSLPADERVTVRNRVSVVEAHRGVLAQQRVEAAETRLVSGEVVERRVLLARPVVDEHTVSLAEGSAPGVLAGQSNVDALQEERAEGEGLAVRPIDRVVLEDPGPLLDHLLQLGMRLEPLRKAGEDLM